MTGESTDEGVGETERGADVGADAPEGSELPKNRLRELERIVVRLEGQVLGLQQRVVDLEAAQRLGRKRALWFRLALLLVLLSIYVIVRARYSS